ncbi:class I SAM-dependent methyltransferase [Nocardioides alcanivorans]|uniref:class I SAM-dependent methyltransferase n=1 Tax=Nocardioides alcanivorans TaxID=2897352 RepID=UPI001F26F95F|nr:hypothetical protein [Nocardioides alcanivorans]
MNPRLRAVLRTTVLTVNTPIAKRRATKAFADAPRPMKLEIGGLTKRPGWVVTNVGALTRNYLDATRRWPLEDASVSHVYSDNVVEHLPLEAGRAMFAETFRCLQHGGVVRMVTPDLRAHVENYLAGKVPAGDPEAKVYQEMGLTVDHPLDWVRIPIASFGHHEGYVYDFETLKLELERVGFRDVVRCDLGESTHAALHGLDQRADEGGAQMAVEATR